MRSPAIASGVADPPPSPAAATTPIAAAAQTVAGPSVRRSALGRSAGALTAAFPAA
jgi:hypothetical protein